MVDIETTKKLDTILAMVTMGAMGAKKALTLSEVSILTGLSKSCLYKKTHKREIPYYRAKTNSKYLFFDRDEIESWMLGCKVKTTDETEVAAATYVVTSKRRKA